MDHRDPACPVAYEGCPLTVARLRARAEALIADDPERVDPATPEELKSLTRELELHHRALGLQNADLRRARDALEVSRNKYFELFELAPVGYLELEESGLILEANLAAAGLLGAERRRLIRTPLWQHVASEDLNLFHAHRQQALESRRPDLCELRLRRGDGTLFDARLESVAVRAVPQAMGMVLLSTVIDVSERKRGEEQLRALTAQLHEANLKLTELAHVDPLTGLLNRRGLARALETECARARRSDLELLGVLVDCDDFKLINDRFGHVAGDSVLGEVGRRLKESLRPSDYLARIGGDEFLLLLPGMGVAEGLRVAERVRLAVSRSPILAGADGTYLSVSLGVAKVPPGTATVEELLGLVGSALRASKRGGKDRVSAQPSAPPQAHTSLATVMQPILFLVDQRLEAVEMLSRAPGSSFSMPDDFFQQAQEQGTLTCLDLACLRSCVQAAQGIDGSVRRHVNLFPSTLLATPAEAMLEIFRESGDPATFCVELSEQQLMGDPLALSSSVRSLRRAGIQFAIDDVGFGRSSLETLILLEPDMVKIDRRLVSGVAGDLRREAALGRLVTMLRALDLKGIAEGIETEADLALLLSLGVESGQGFLLGRPAAGLPSGRTSLLTQGRYSAAGLPS